MLQHSVVYADRALNHMSRRIQGVMRGNSPQAADAWFCAMAG
ncbi:MAG: hypothetical protein ACKOF9_16355 [Burkholderiales bacterium]